MTTKENVERVEFKEYLTDEEQVKKEKYAKWLSDKETLTKHLKQLPREDPDNKEVAFQDKKMLKTNEKSCVYMRVSQENADRFVDEYNEDLKERLEGKEKEEFNKDLNKFILDDSELPQVLDHAVGKIKIKNKNYRYYGIKVNELILKKQRGKLIQTTELSPGIVLENGKIITENNKPEDVNFVFDSIMTLKRNRWSLNSIKFFCEGNLNKKDYTFEKVFNDVKKFYDEGMVFENDMWYFLLPLRDLKTYFWDLNDKFLIIKHEGISGVAKSKGMRIGANLSFNGKKFLCPTPANFFRYRHHNKATLFMEEMERLFDDSKKKTTGDSELVEYLNGSYEKGNTVPRQNDKNINQTDEFDPAGDSAIGSIKPLRGALGQRSVALHMIKAPKGDLRGNIEPPPEDDSKYCSIRNKIYICGLLNYKKYEDSLKNIKNDYGLANRQWVLAKPLIALASCINKNLEKKIGSFLVRLFEIRDFNFDEQSWEMIMAQTVIKLFSQHEVEKFLSVEFIKNQFTSELDEQSPRHYDISNTKIGMILSSLGFTDFRENPTGNQRGYRLDFYKVIEILLRQGFVVKENILKIVSEVSGGKYNDDKINKWYTDTYLTLNKKVSVSNLTLEKKNKKIKRKSDTSDTLTLGLEGGVGKFTPLESLNIAGYKKGQEIKITLEPDKEYSIEDLGDLGKEMSQILLQDNKIKLINELKEAKI